MIVGSEYCATCKTSYLFTRKATATERPLLTVHHQTLYEQPKGFQTMFTERQPFYLRGVTPRTETVDNETRKRVELELMAQPFTSKMARDLEVLNNLFAKVDGDPIDDMLKCELKIAVPIQRMTVSMAADTEVGRVFDNVRVDSVLRVRRDKESPVYAATLYVDFPYPAPEDLLFLFNSYLEQLFVTFETMQGNLGLSDPPEDAAPKKRGRKKVDEAQETLPDTPPAESTEPPTTVN